MSFKTFANKWIAKEYEEDKRLFKFKIYDGYYDGYIFVYGHKDSVWIEVFRLRYTEKEGYTKHSPERYPLLKEPLHIGTVSIEGSFIKLFEVDGKFEIEKFPKYCKKVIEAGITILR